VTDLTGSLLNRCPYRREDNIMTTHLMAFVKWTHILGRNKGLGAEKQNQRIFGGAGGARVAAAFLFDRLRI